MKIFKRLLAILALVLFLVCLAGFIFVRSKMKDRHPGYHVDINYSAIADRPVDAGFAAIKITPTVEDTWNDVNGDARFVEEDGDTYRDRNKNGKFDPVWIAGFHNRRPAQGIHDDLWARTMILSDGEFTLSYSVLDVIGFGSDDIIAIRKKIKDEVPVDYAIISSTHTHEGPDLIGLWGESEMKNGVDPDYLEYVIQQTAASIYKAYANREQVRIKFAQDMNAAEHLVMDSRKPEVLDPGVRVMAVESIKDSTTIGTIVHWGNHPETTWDKNLLISSDFAHYIRKGIEEGVMIGDSLLSTGLGGICIYTQGSIGGLMTTAPEFGIPHLISGDTLFEPSFLKAESQGMAIAQIALKALGKQDSYLSQGELSVKARSIELAMDNKLYKLALIMGVLDKGLINGWKIRSEIAHWSIGPAEFLHHPSELYPEILMGGVESPEGGDFDIAPIETPALNTFLNKEYQFVCGLSNDMIGYVIPKSQWDVEAPYTYDNGHAPYGEINSLGPETGPTLYAALKAIFE